MAYNVSVILITSKQEFGYDSLTLFVHDQYRVTVGKKQIIHPTGCFSWQWKFNSCFTKSTSEKSACLYPEPKQNQNHKYPVIFKDNAELSTKYDEQGQAWETGLKKEAINWLYKLGMWPNTYTYYSE